MKTSVVIIDNEAQVVLTPETEFENNIIGRIPALNTTKIRRGSFFKCVAGHYRYSDTDEEGDDSLIISIGG